MQDKSGSCKDDVLDRVARSFPSVYWRWEIGVEIGRDVAVEEELCRRLPHIDPHSWRARFELGGVYVAGREASFGQQLVPPCRLEYYEPKVVLEKVAETYPALSSESILYRDQDLAVVLKPTGLPTTPPRDQHRYHLQGQLEEMIGQKVHLPSRLDAGVVGLLIASLSPRMNRHLQRAYDARRIEKYYVCEVSGWPEWSERVCKAAIERDPRHPVLRRCAADLGHGEGAETRFRCLRRFEYQGERRALLQAEPITGRTHQIRLHCQWEGVPIVGDPYYGLGQDGVTLRLVSFALRFFHPYRAEVMSWEISSSNAPAWLSTTWPHEIHYRNAPEIRHTAGQ